MFFLSRCRAWVWLSVFFFGFFMAVEQSRAASFADAVVDYDSGVDFAVEYGSGLGYTLPESALGSPNLNTGFGELHPFNPPFSRQDLVSIGEGGHLTVQFDSPLINRIDSYFGMDFIIYGSTGFIDVDYPQGISDNFGSIFSQNPGQTEVSVSPDNITFYRLDPALAPTVDGYYPTDGQGQFGQPMDPSLDPADFANLTLDQIRALYDGAAGGTAFDLAWALDGTGQPVHLDAVSYVRIDVLSGRSEIDAMAMVVPEPGPISLWAVASILGLIWGRFFARRCPGLCREKRVP